MREPVESVAKSGCDVRKNFIMIATGLLAGMVVLAAVLLARAPGPVLAPTADPALHFDQSAGTEARIRALEAAVAQERNARMLLEEELQALYAALDELAAAPANRVENGAGGDVATAFGDVRRQAMADDVDWRRGRLVDAGFSEDRAEWILRRESELQM